MRTRIALRQKTTAPAWVMRPDARVGPQARFDLDFVNNRAWMAPHAMNLSDALSCARASPSTTYYEQADGTLISFAANTLRRGDRGILSEPARTNVVLWNRDLTNAAWTATNVTAVKDQTGVDGVSNAASSLTATAGNGTVLQAITLASSARWQTCYIKRLTGSGAVEMTMDNGTTWTAVTVTSSWTRVAIPTQTLANPTVGFRIVTSGDAVAVDFVQNENSGVEATSPIATTTASVTRSADVLTVPTAIAQRLCTPGGYTVFTQAWGKTANGTDLGALWQLDNIGAGVVFARLSSDRWSTLGRDPAAATQFSQEVDAGSTFGARQKHKFAYAIGNNSVFCCSENGSATEDTSATVPIWNRITIGSQNSGQWWTGYIERFAMWDRRLTNDDCKRLTATATDFLVLAEGDSITVSPSNAGWAHYLRVTSPTDRWSVQILAVSGSALQSVSGAAFDLTASGRFASLQAQLDRYRAANPTLKSCTVIFIGHNDKAVDGDSTSTFLSQYASYLASLRSAGHSSAGRHKIAVVGVPPSTSPADLNTWRGTVNTALSAYPGVECDYYVDLTSVTGCTDGDASDTSYWSDGIHPTTAQSVRLAEAIKAQALDNAAA